MRYEPPAFVPDEKRPRAWADDVRAGRVPFSAVPAHLSGIVRRYLAPLIDEHAAWVMLGRTRDQRKFRLNTLPAGVRGMVEDRVRELFAVRPK